MTKVHKNTQHVIKCNKKKLLHRFVLISDSCMLRNTLCIAIIQISYILNIDSGISFPSPGVLIKSLPPLRKLSMSIKSLSNICND